MNKTYVITGATSGIGLELVKVLASENKVFAGYRSEDKKVEFANLPQKNIYPFYIDYAKPETIQNAISEIKSKCKKIDTLINIAGCVVAGPIEKIPINDLRHQFDVNVFGHLELAQGLSDLLKDGRIINVSSMASYGIFPFISPYCASKRALDMLFNSFMLENKNNIKVISIKPGVIATPLWGKSISENIKNLENCTGYQKEMNFLINNAKRNSVNGLKTDNVVKVILKADLAKKPKLTYTVGFDALVARFSSKLPQSLVNKVIKLGMKIRVK